VCDGNNTKMLVSEPGPLWQIKPKRRVRASYYHFPCFTDVSRHPVRQAGCPETSVK